MVQINFGQREVSCKLVYYGPGMSGKTTNLEIIHQKAPQDSRGEMVSIATETDRTLYFDYLPLDLGQVAGMHTRFQLYTVPGQIYYNATRKLVLQGVDGVIFVADSGKDKMGENLESMQNLRDNLADMALSLDDIPLVIQYNKRDLPDILTVEMLNEQLNPAGVPWTEAVACDGKGVFPTLKALSKQVIEKLNKEHAPSAQRRRTNQALPSVETAQSGAIPQPRQTPTPAQAAPTQRSPAAQSASPEPPPTKTAPAPAPTPATSTTPADGTPNGPQAKERHLAKPPPPQLGGNRRRSAGGSRTRRQTQDTSQNDNVHTTEPNLKKFKIEQQQQRSGGSRLLYFLSLTILTLILIIIIVSLLIIFIKPVGMALSKYMPTKLEKLIYDLHDDTLETSSNDESP